MALWPWRAQVTVDAVQASFTELSPTPQAGAWPTGWPELSAGYDYPVTREEALAVPAVTRAVDLMATTVASLPIERLVFDAAGKRHRVSLTGLMEQPEPGRTRYATLTDTARDLILDGRAYWIVRDRYAAWGLRNGERVPARGLPKSVRYVPAALVTENKEAGSVTGPVTSVTYGGKTYPISDVILFEGWHSGIRNHGARIIRTALALEQAARRYADVPLPSLIIKNTSAYELSQAEITELIDGVKKARQASAVGYVNAGADLDTMGWNSEQLQLVEARVFTNAAIANLCGIPAHFIAASNVGGSSLTYSNASQEARTLIDYGMKPLLTAIEERLSLNDVSPRGHRYRFELDALLRGNPMERSQLYHSLIPLGVLTVEEAREWEDLTPMADIPPAPNPTPTPEPKGPPS